ncbi:hypothetical protein FDP22_04260 [Paroceanicella profunda]|uniref:Uncharacterized protein n=1 Tax=Paroceanicella profunda TaxID=2579971 RepID=A0A5B8FGI4_9RHOB|nr:hypothetical protein FDP22_04260 [Paroceanicella profunda]
MRHGLSGTPGVGRSGTRNTDYREHLSPENPQKTARNHPLSNYPNRKESFGFLLTARVAVEDTAPFGQRPARRHRAAPIAALIPGDNR